MKLELKNSTTQLEHKPTKTKPNKFTAISTYISIITLNMFVFYLKNTFIQYILSMVPFLHSPWIFATSPPPQINIFSFSFFRKLADILKPNKSE